MNEQERPVAGPRCPSCGGVLDEEEITEPVCVACDQRFERDLERWIAYVSAQRADARLTAS